MPRLSAVLVLFAVAMLVLGIHDLTRGLTAASLIAPVDAAAAADAPEAAGPDAEPEAGPDAEPEAGPDAEAESPREPGELTTDQLDIGTVVTTADGATLYRFDRDSPRPSKSTCNGQCAATWPPLWATNGIPSVDGVDPALVGTVTRDDGNKQVTLAGWPLYRYAPDSPGEAEGNGFGGTWHAVAPDGRTVIAPVAEPVARPAPRVAPEPRRRLTKSDQRKPDTKKRDGKKQRSRGSR